MFVSAFYTSFWLYEVRVMNYPKSDKKGGKVGDLPHNEATSYYTSDQRQRQKNLAASGYDFGPDILARQRRPQPILLQHREKPNIHPFPDALRRPGNRF